MKRSIAAILLAPVLVVSGCSDDGDQTPEQSPGTNEASPGSTNGTADPSASASTPSTQTLTSFAGGVCNGIVTEERLNADILVPAGGTCSLEKVTLNGNVAVAEGATLTVTDSTIRRSLLGTKHRSVVVSDTRISRDVRLREGEEAKITKTRIEGDLTATANRGAQEFNDNRIGGSLTCRDNETIPMGTGNDVTGSTREQCADL